MSVIDILGQYLKIYTLIFMSLSVFNIISRMKGITLIPLTGLQEKQKVYCENCR